MEDTTEMKHFYILLDFNFFVSTQLEVSIISILSFSGHHYGSTYTCENTRVTWHSKHTTTVVEAWLNLISHSSYEESSVIAKSYFFQQSSHMSEDNPTKLSHV